MIDSIGQMDLNGSSSISIIGFSKSLKKEWHNNYGLLTWEYRQNHIKQSDMDQLNCFTFGLGGNCEHSHKQNPCIKCLTYFSFFKRKVFPFLKNANEEISLNNRDEVATMMDAVPNISYEVSHCTSHRLRTNVHFFAIEEIIQSMKTYLSIIYMIPYHKQKN